jgi:excisionase family DNA binding protein
MAASRQRIDDGRATPVRTAFGRLALSKQEAADALGVSVDFLEEHVMHELRVVRRGRRRLIPVVELERWLERSASSALEEVPHARGERSPISSPKESRRDRPSSPRSQRGHRDTPPAQLRLQ